MDKSLIIDLRMIDSSGIGTYLKSLIPMIIKRNKKYIYSLLGNLETLQQLEWTQGANVKLIHSTAPIYSLKEQYDLIHKIPKHIDLFWSPHYNIPICYKGKLLVTIHDLAHLALKHSNMNIVKNLYAKFFFNRIVDNADAIITVSQFTANELSKYAGKHLLKKVHVIHNGISNKWFNIPNHNTPYEKPFIIYVGNVKPNKNLSRLLDAFSIIKEKIHHDLIIIGKKEGFITGDPIIQTQAKSIGSRIKFTGFVNEKVLEQYYTHAAVLVFPSLYEGFGFPPLEAMACGCPVVASRAASIPEVCGSAVLYFDPHSIQDIANKIIKLLTDRTLREEFIFKGRERARRFSWERAVNQTVSVIGDVFA